MILSASPIEFDNNSSAFVIIGDIITLAIVSHAALITSPMSSKSKPSELSFSTTAFWNVSNLFFTSSKMPVTLSLKSSLVFHKYTKDAARAAIIAVIAIIGALRPVNAAPRVFILPNAITTLLTARTTLDIIRRTGPIAAAINPNLTTWSFCSSDNSLNFVTSSDTLSAAFVKNGTNLSPTAISKPSTADFNSVKEPFRLLSCSFACCAAEPCPFISSLAFANPLSNWSSFSDVVDTILLYAFIP